MSGIDKNTYSEALERFVTGATPEERRSALTALISAKFLPKNAADAAVRAGRDRILADTATAADPVHKLLAIAEAIRLSQVVKKWVPEITQRLTPAFTEELPPLRLLPDADDRLNVARACSLMTADWMVSYLARCIADEEQGEKTRAELMAGLLRRANTLSDAVQALSHSFERVRPQTESPGDTVARRLTRTLVALRLSLVDSDREAGRELGKGMHALVSGTFVEVGRPQDDKVKVEFAKEVLLTVHDVVRTRLSEIAEPSMYEPVTYCKRLFADVWPDELLQPLNQLASDVCEALVLLGRQGRRDQVLLGQLTMLCKYPEKARSMARELAARHPELNEEVRDWLELGRIRAERAPSAAALEASASNADAAIGLALQAARHAKQSTEALRERLLSSLEVFEPSLLRITKDAFDRIKVLSIQVEQAATLRNLELLGTPGTEVEASPKFFEVIGGQPRQTMVVRQPAVVKTRSDGQPGEVVLKGLVE